MWSLDLREFVFCMQGVRLNWHVLRAVFVELGCIAVFVRALFMFLFLSPCFWLFPQICILLCLFVFLCVSLCLSVFVCVSLCLFPRLLLSPCDERKFCRTF